MKKLKLIISLFVLAFLLGCSTDTGDTNVAVNAPTNISALTTVTQDNSGAVTFTPSGEGVSRYEIYFGDATVAPAYVNSGETTTHKYAEGVYQAKIVGTTLDGKKAQVIQEVVVSFKAPENLKVVIKNDLSVSKKVTVTATADFALFYDVYFGEAGKPNPISVNIKEPVSYTYQTAGVYKIRVVAKSAAIKTTEETKDFTVTVVSKPITSATTPPSRLAADVISIYSSKYTNVAGTDYFPDWKQGAQGSSWAEFDLNGDKMLNYINLSYQGIALAGTSSIDVSKMDFLHLDVWTSDVQKLETSLINKSIVEKAVLKDLVAGQWTSIDIPISAYTSQGLTVKDIFQLKFVGTVFAKGSVFIDNVYFYKAPSAAQTIQLPIDFESNILTYTWTGFGDASSGPIPATVIANPNKLEINVSGKVLKIEKPAGAQVWAGASLDLTSAMDLTKGKKVTIAVWSPKVGAKILYKMEVSSSPKDANGNPTVNIEVQATTTVANKWELLTFDLTTAPTFNATFLYDRVALFPDFGQAGSGTSYYFDDIKQSN